MKNRPKIHRDKKGRDFIKESYYINGKMKHRRIYVIDGIPAEEFYEQNATDVDHMNNGDYHLMSCDQESTKVNNNNSNSVDDEDIPF